MSELLPYFRERVNYNLLKKDSLEDVSHNPKNLAEKDRGTIPNPM